MIDVKDLTITDPAGRAVLDRVRLSAEPGERLGVVGESGAGKSTLALSLIAAVRPGLRVTGGGVLIDGRDALSLRGAALRELRRTVVSYLHQDPSSALTPTIRVRGQIAELAADRSAEAIAARLADLGLPADHRFQRRYPHQLSGGQRQRLALARATAGNPRVLVLDEPTTGLDALARALVLDRIDALVRERGLSLVLITHDLAAASALCDRVAVLRDGTLVEHGATPQVMESPTSDYARELIRAVPVIDEAWQRAGTSRADGDPVSGRVLRVRDLSASHREGRRRHTVVSGISFDVAAGECVALLGLSGSGKTTIARCVAGTHRPDAGAVELAGEVVAPQIRARSVEQRRRVQLVPQHSAGSFNPRRTIGEAIARPLRLLRGMDRDQARAQTFRLLGAVGLPEHLAERLPGQLSGGQCQRAAIARALATDPDVLLCDEMTSNLDAQVQAAVLALLADLRARLELAVVLITHDLGVLARAADRVIVLHEGRVCEQGPVAEVLRHPRHEWTRALVRTASATPVWS